MHHRPVEGAEPLGGSPSMLGQAVLRREDHDLLCGTTAFVGDMLPAGCLHVVFVRSTAAHARILSVDVGEARAAAGVRAVLIAKDLVVGDMGEWPPPVAGSDPELARPCLARAVVRFVGEAIAVVVAETPEAAMDAAELVVVELDPLPVIVNPLDALAPDAPLLFPRHGSNVVLDLAAEGHDDPLEGAEVIVRARFHNQRVAPVPLEANGALGLPDGRGGITLWASTQAPFAVRAVVSAALGLPPSAVTVIAPSVGGGFGAKGGAYPEQVIVAALVRRLDAPVRWLETRSENMVAMSHGRGQIQDVELGARSDGTIVGLRVRTVTDVGAYPGRGRIAARTSRLMSSGVYRIGRIGVHTVAVVTNTSPVGPYRGAGRPEAAAMLERAIDLLAAEVRADPVELRRRNLIRPDEFPFLTPTGACYDTGDYDRALTQVVAAVDYDAVRAEQASRRATEDPRVVGIGLACFVEVSGTGWEFGSVRVEADGRVTVVSGSSPHGQGHETTLAQIAGSVLGVPFDRIRVIHSDTSRVPRGVGTFGSRSGQLAGSAVFRAGETVLRRAEGLAAQLLEAAVDDIVRTPDGGFSVAGSPSMALSWAQVARASWDPVQVGPGMAPYLAEEGDFAQEQSTYPFGAHAAVVEVDTETGRVMLRRFVAVDDCGTIVNPAIVAGQVHGGLAQGVAQAMFEAVVYDDAGNPRASTLAEYGFPSAADLPSWEISETVTPSPRNPLGMKGIGESGAVGGAVAVQNAVIDAVRHLGVSHIDMPLTPGRVWEALRGADGVREPR